MTAILTGAFVGFYKDLHCYDDMRGETYYSLK